MPSYQAIVFDLGNVLIEWDPGYVFNHDYFDSPGKREFFFNHICTAAWNEEQDAGRSITEGTFSLIEKFPDWEPAIRDYYGRWTEMLRGPIHGSVEIFRQLKEEGNYKLYALTNWNAGLFDIALVRYNFLQWFDGRVVSGEEKIRKPFFEFYQVLLDRYGLAAAETIFIDDSLRNINAAAEMGMTCIHFQNPEQLRGELLELEVLRVP